MRPAPLVALLALALNAPATAVARAAPAEPTRPVWASPNSSEEYCGSGDNWHEGGTGHVQRDQTKTNDSMSVNVLGPNWLVLSWYDGDCTWYNWYRARRGSFYFLNFCDQHGEEYFMRVSRVRFLHRVGAFPEQDIKFLYNRERDWGVFRADTYWGWIDEPCEVRERRSGTPRLFRPGATAAG